MGREQQERDSTQDYPAASPGMWQAVLVVRFGSPSSECAQFAAERAECLRRVRAVVGPRSSAELRQAMARADAELFLGDRLLRQLPQQVALDVNATICNFLHVAGRKRQPLWREFCQDNNDWKLK